MVSGRGLSASHCKCEVDCAYYALSVMNDIVTIDCHYLDRPEFAAAYLLVDGDEAVFVDNNTNHAVPLLLQALADAGLDAGQVRYLIVTHAHLDHSGGTAKLAEACPQAGIVAHPRAAPHLINPEKLVAGAAAVYGEEQFTRLYGTISPVPAARVVTMEDGEALDFGRGGLTFLHTRGHANHHFCIADEVSGAVFTGDAFGLHYPALQSHGPFAFPSTSPTGFDAELARQAICRLVELRPAAMYPTHYGAVGDIAAAASQMLNHLDFAERVTAEAAASDHPDDALEAFIKPRLTDFFAGLLTGYGPLATDPATWQLLELDIDLNAQGMAVTAIKQRRKAAKSGH